MKIRASRRKFDRRLGRKSKKWIDRTGMINGRLVFLEWLGTYGTKAGVPVHWWRALCDCGRTCTVVWRKDVRSCGCLQAEARVAHGWESQRPDGRWGPSKPERLYRIGDRELTVKKLAREVGISGRAMQERIGRWPQDRWLDPPQWSGKDHHRKRALIRRRRKGEKSERARQLQADKFGGD